MPETKEKSKKVVVAKELTKGQVILIVIAFVTVVLSAISAAYFIIKFLIN